MSKSKKPVSIGHKFAIGSLVEFDNGQMGEVVNSYSPKVYSVEMENGNLVSIHRAYDRWQAGNVFVVAAS